MLREWNVRRWVEDGDVSGRTNPVGRGTSAADQLAQRRDERPLDLLAPI